MLQNDWIGNVQAILQMKQFCIFPVISGGSSILYLFRVIIVLSAWFRRKEKKKINRDSLDEQPMHVQPHWMNAKTVYASRAKKLMRTGMTGLNPTV